MTLVDKHALTAALAERDAARAEVARLRAAVVHEVREARRSDPSTYNVWIRVSAAIDRALGDGEGER